MDIVLCAVDFRLAQAWRQALPQESAAPAMLRGIQDVFFPRPFPASLADVNTF